MAVTLELSDLEYARLAFENLLKHNNRSSDKNLDGTYYYRDTENWWVIYQSGFRKGRESANGTCDF